MLYFKKKEDESLEDILPGLKAELFAYSYEKIAELTPAAVAVRIRLETADGTLLAEQTAQAAETGKMQLSVPDAQPWDTEHPAVSYTHLKRRTHR